MNYPFVDAQGLAGHLTLGAVKTGRYDLKHRVSLPGAFGDEVVETNRNILTGPWEQEVGNAVECTPHQAACVAGLPPCSGFSLMNMSKGTKKRGSSSSINQCMKELVMYASRCKGMDGALGPEIVCFESVQGAFSQGRDLMQALRFMLEERTGIAYDLTHVKMSGTAVGAAQYRHRYFWVAHRIPFGADPPEPHKLETWRTAIEDLKNHEIQWEEQPYLSPPLYDFQVAHRRKDGRFDAHVTINPQARHMTKYMDLLDDWIPGENIQAMIRRTGRVPEHLKHKWDGNDLQGWSYPSRPDPDKPGFVLHGGCLGQFFHWEETRLLTVRECSRLMGFPDEWSWEAAGRPDHAGSWIGKGCPVQSAMWITGWIARALDGEPGRPGKLIGDREFLHDSTLDYRRWPEEVSGWRLK